MLTSIQKQKFLETSGKEYEGDELEGQFLTNRAYNVEVTKKTSHWIFSYVIEADTGNLICELEHRLTNNRIYGWDKDGNELPNKLTEKYFRPHL